MKKIFLLLLVVLTSGMLIHAVQSIQAPKDSIFTNNSNTATIKGAVDDFAKTYTIKATPLPEELFFAKEQVPLQDPDIKERLDREILVNTYWQSNAVLLIKRANKYFPVIEPILAQYGVPNDFKYLAVIESGLQNVVSPARASGFWQIMKTTGKQYGLEINTNVDERYHLEKATKVACAYLLEAKKKFGSWTLAAAAYNAGPHGIARRLKAQKVDAYYDLLLGQETGRYLFRILAIKEILSDPMKYGFDIPDTTKYNLVPTRTIAVDTAVINLAQFSKDLGINYKVLKIHNPWLREPHLNNKSRKKYFIKIPHKGYYN